MRKSLLLNTHTDVPRRAGDLIYFLNLPQLPYFMCARNEGAGETALMCRLARTFTGRCCDDKHQNRLRWLIYSVSMKLPVSNFRYFGEYIIQLIGYCYFHVSGQRQTVFER